MILHHPSEATLIAYASGALGEASAVVIATHLLACPVCRAMTSLAEMVGGVMFEQSPVRELSRDALDRAIAGLDRPSLVTPRMRAPEPPQEPETPAEADPWPSTLRPYQIGEWRWLLPGVLRTQLNPGQGGGTLDLLRLAPGAALPSYGRAKLELVCVLEGSFSDRRGRFGPGEIAEIDASMEQRPVADEADCVCLMAVDRDLKLHGLFERLLQPIAE